MTENGATRVKFDLWAVLGFLVLLVGICVGYLFVAQAANKEERQGQVQALDKRVTVIEINYEHILKGIDVLQKGQKDLVDALTVHEKTTLRAIRGKE
jgi:uncharacterized membrane-anchored protein YhcB (DUF1043 family)